MTIDINNHEESIKFTQGVRKRIIDEMLAQPTLPSDKDDRNFLMSALDGMDRVTVAKARIKNDESVIKNQERAADLIGEVLKSVRTSSLINLNPVERIMEVDYEVVDVVPGEMEHGIQSLNLEKFLEEN
jgi:hypothetical protein